MQNRKKIPERFAKINHYIDVSQFHKQSAKIVNTHLVPIGFGFLTALRVIGIEPPEVSPTHNADILDSVAKIRDHAKRPRQVFSTVLEELQHESHLFLERPEKQRPVKMSRV